MHRVIKVGVFDSGVGGKLIAKKLEQALPSVDVVFRSDPEYFPYGNKTPEVILERVSLFAKKFQQLGCAIVVIACNSATTNVIERLRQLFPRIQFVGVEPPVKPIVRMTKSGKVAVMGTETTIKSLRLKRLVKQCAGHVEVSLIACPGFAEYIEYIVIARSPRRGNLPSGMRFSRDVPLDTSPATTDKTSKDLLKKFLDTPIAEGVDVVGIACTHYPYLLPKMKELYPHVTFYDPADAVVNYVKKIYFLHFLPTHPLHILSLP